MFDARNELTAAQAELAAVEERLAELRTRQAALEEERTKPVQAAGEKALRQHIQQRHAREEEAEVVAGLIAQEEARLEEARSLVQLRRYQCDLEAYDDLAAQLDAANVIALDALCAMLDTAKAAKEQLDVVRAAKARIRSAEAALGLAEQPLRGASTPVLGASIDKCLSAGLSGADVRGMIATATAQQGLPNLYTGSLERTETVHENDEAAVLVKYRGRFGVASPIPWAGPGR